MLALTVWQPWAASIAWLGKDVENRPWPVPRTVTGDIAIHAAQKIDGSFPGVALPAAGYPPASGVVHDEFRRLFASPAEMEAWRRWCLGYKPRDEGNWPRKLALGAVVAVARIADWHACSPDAEVRCGRYGDWSWIDPQCRPGYCSAWAAGSGWHWRLTRVRPLAVPVPCRGHQRMWPLPADVDAAVCAQLTKETSRGNA